MTSLGYRLNPRYVIKECSSCGTLYTRDCSCSKGNVEDKILVPKPLKNCASTNVVNIPLEPFVVKQDHESFVDKIICGLNKAPDSPYLHTFSPNQRHCFHCKDVLGDGEACQRCTCKRCGSGLSKGLCLIYRNNQNSPNDSLSISANSSHNPPHIDERCFECGDELDGIFCQQCACKSCGKGAHNCYNCPPKVSIISNPEPCNQTMNNEPPQTLLSFDSTCYSDKEISVPCVSKPNFVDESSNIFNPPPQPPIYSCEFCGSNFSICLEVEKIVIPEDEEIEDDNFREKLLNVNLLIAKIEALKDNPLHLSKISSGSTTTQSDISLPEYDSFIFDLSNDQFPPTDRSDFTHQEFDDEPAHIISPPEYDCFFFGNLPDPGELISSLNFGIRENLSSTTCVNLPVEDDHSPLLAYIVWIFLAYLTYPVLPPHLYLFGNEDTIFDPGITINRSNSFKYLIGVELSRNSILTVFT
nr:hypothetical protein [Tanacetum cinerariifolium]